MPIAPGTRLGPYEITALIGAGGMGEVYRATDTNLKRPVAIKVLPDALAADADRLARFQREAEVVASLNHPNIAHVHGLEKGPAGPEGPARPEGPAKAGHHATIALVMELVEGPTLADRIAEGPIPVNEALAIARQIADALEAAHERSIVHRDLKPANVKLRPDGIVKVLDFGLARALDPAPQTATTTEVLANSPTVTSPALTSAGVILGTAAYMSPEQARGRVVDRRADVWAFGCVLFEMLTGRAPFEGATVVDVIGAVLHKEPDLQALPPSTPPVVRATIDRCLQKDLRQRARDLGDVRLALDGGFSAQTIDAAAAPVAPRRSWLLPVAVLATAVIAGTFAWNLRRPAPPPERTPVRFQIAPPQGVDFGSFFSVSPDGRTLVFNVANPTLGFRYWIHSFETGETKPITRIGSTNSSQFWSPDSQFMAFAEGGQLKRMDMAGGPADTICPLPSSFGGGSWGADGTIIVGSPSGPLWRVPATGGKPVAITALDASRDEVGHVNPWLLRDGRHFLYLRASRNAADSALSLGSLDAAPGAQSDRRLLATAQGVVYVPGSGNTPDYVLFVRNGSLLAQVFDPDALSLVGEAMPVAERVGVGPPTYAQAWASESGTLVYREPTTSIGGTPAWFDRTGRERSVIPGMESIAAMHPRLSPDGTRLALFVAGDLWVYDLAGRPPVRLTTGALGYSPVWTHDSKQIVYELTGSVGLRMLPADGTGVTPEVVGPRGHYHPHTLSHDGRFLLTSYENPATERWSIYRMPMAPGANPEPLFESRSAEGFSGIALSPDGRWLAYVSQATGAWEVWVRPYPGPGSPVRISSNGGTEPLWNRNGRELFYLHDEDMMSVAVDARGDTFTFQPAVRLFTARMTLKTQPPSYDVAADGSFLLLKPSATASSPINVILDWRSALGKRIPTGTSAH
jgi:Tol biopolymer transport system component